MSASDIAWEISNAFCNAARFELSDGDGGDCGDRGPCCVCCGCCGRGGCGGCCGGGGCGLSSVAGRPQRPRCLVSSVVYRPVVVVYSVCTDDASSAAGNASAVTWVSSPVYLVGETANNQTSQSSRNETHTSETHHHLCVPGA